ncbi:MAG TPA: response regulator [Chthoniobacterales bacterium]|nr:response regulator [Chthoniobacterales bacterium]
MPEANKPICILDDDLSVLSSLRELLESDGFESETFDNPEKFLAYASEHQVKVVVLDVWMPVTNGIEVQERLRELSPSTRVVMITGREAPAIRAEALKRGARAFLVKPFADDALLAAVRDALGEEEALGEAVRRRLSK